VRHVSSCSKWRTRHWRLGPAAERLVFAALRKKYRAVWNYRLT